MRFVLTAMGWLIKSVILVCFTTQFSSKVSNTAMSHHMQPNQCDKVQKAMSKGTKKSFFNIFFKVLSNGNV
jgi:hypothetical protein